MSITKGIVQGGNYTFSAANQTITFSSDYLGLSLSDITYITNIKSGVATVIYDPFDAAKGGVLNGLTLTLAYNTTLMVDTDPLQIIVGFTPSNPAPINVNLTGNPQLESQTELLSSMADAMDMLSRVTDDAERIQVNVKETATKRDVQGANVTSDAPEPIHINIPASNGKTFTIDTTGYNSFVVTWRSNAGCQVFLEMSNDGVDWISAPTINSTNSNSYSTTTVSVTFPFNIGIGTLYYWVTGCILKLLRFRIANASGGGEIKGTGYLRTQSLPTGPFTQIPVAANINQISGTGVQISGGTATNTTQGVNQLGGIQVGGPFFPTTNAPNAASILQTSVVYPFGIAGREQPYVGALSGLLRYITVDGGGRYILGGDTPDTETRTQSKLASGAVSGIPPRGVGARSNTMFGSQALLVENISQSEGDTMPTLLQQILVELKMLNQQINELPLTLNLGIKMQNEVGDYRQEEYNNHVNNQ